MLQRIRLNIVVSIVYFVGGQIGLALHGPSTGAPLVWLPTGIAVAALINYGYKTLPGIALGAFAVVISQSPPTHMLSLTLGIPLQIIAGPLQAFIAVWLLRKSGVEDSPLDSLINLTKFLFICAGFSTVFSATPGVAALLINGFTQADNIFFAWLNWWFADALGVLVAAPLALSIVRFKSFVPTIKEEFEFVALYVSTLLIVHIIFSDTGVSHQDNHTLIFLTIPLIVWAGLRFQQIGASIVSFTIVVIAILGTANNYGPFDLDADYSNLQINLFLVVLSATGLALATSIFEREQTKNELFKSQARSSHLLNSSPVVIYTCEPSGNFPATFISGNVKTLMGFEPENFLADPSFWASNIHPEDAPRVFEELGGLFEHGKHTHEYRFRKPDGTYIVIHDDLRLITDDNGSPKEIIGSWADVSELQAAKIKLNRKEAEIIRFGRTVAINEMGTTILHEINTPIQIASSSAYLALNDYEKETATLESMADKLKNIQDALKRVAEVEGHIRKYVSGDRSKLEAIDVNHTLKATEKFLNTSLRERQIRIKFDLQQDLPKAIADVVELEQVLINLINNACEAMQNTPLENQEIRISSEVDDHRQIKVTVSDNGSGVSEEAKLKIFNPFNTTKPNGVGMGLSICRSIMESFGGSINVESDGLTGSSFILRLPPAKDRA